MRPPVLFAAAWVMPRLRSGLLGSALFVLFAVCGLPLPVWAGRACAPKPVTAVTVEQAMGLAQRTARALEDTGAQVVVLARAGQDLSRFRLRWSHLGWAYRDGGRWYVVHKLNDCGRDTAALYRQGLGEFFLDDMFEYRSAFIVPQPEFQQRLLPMLRQNAAAAAMHESRYSLVSYPWSQRYQQSNQWVLETLARALDDEASDRVRAQQVLKARGYEPAALQIGALERLGGRLTAANVAFDDHPNDKRFSNRIETVTVESVFDWMSRSGLSGTPQFVP
mgnify:CR=1 FL=1